MIQFSHQSLGVVYIVDVVQNNILGNERTITASHSHLGAKHCRCVHRAWSVIGTRCLTILVDTATSHLAQLVAILPLREKDLYANLDITSDLSVIGLPWSAARISLSYHIILSSNLIHKNCKSFHLPSWICQPLITLDHQTAFCRVSPRPLPHP